MPLTKTDPLLLLNTTKIYIHLLHLWLFQISSTCLKYRRPSTVMLSKSIHHIVTTTCRRSRTSNFLILIKLTSPKIVWITRMTTHQPPHTCIHPPFSQDPAHATATASASTVTNFHPPTTPITNFEPGIFTPPRARCIRKVHQYVLGDKIVIKQ